MRVFETHVQELKNDVLRSVAKLAWADEMCIRDRARAAGSRASSIHKASSRDSSFPKRLLIEIILSYSVKGIP